MSEIRELLEQANYSEQERVVIAKGLIEDNERLRGDIEHSITDLKAIGIDTTNLEGQLTRMNEHTKFFQQYVHEKTITNKE